MRYVGDEPPVRPGPVAPALADEHPGLRLAWTEVEATPGPTPRELRERLRAMADRMRGAQAIAVRRMRQGGLRPQGLVDDAITVAVLETGVGMWAFDAARLVGAPGLGEAGGHLVIADEAGTLAVLFRDPAPRAAVTKATRRIALVAVAVPDVPELHVQEAIWTAWDILA
jgi:DNA/RNA-binding domain of Phe-tRNA-synthetase-like protein